MTAFRALHARTFRRYWLGQIVSLTGTWTQQVAVAALAFRLTGSSAMVGLALLLTQVPILLLSPLAGVVNDRVARRHVLLATQAATVLQASALGLLDGGGHLGIMPLLVLCSVAGLISALDTPARQAIVSSMIDEPANLRNAVALSGLAVHLARLLGPALAALLMHGAGARACFYANAASSLVFCAVLWWLPDRASDRIRRVTVDALREGWTYCARDRRLRGMLALVAASSLLAIPYASVLPAALALWQAPIGYASLMAFAGAGAVAAALWLAASSDDRLLGAMLLPAAVLAGATLLMLGSAGGRLGAPGSALVVAALGFLLTLVVSGSNVLIQHATPDALRGRVTGLFVVAFNGIAPLGALLLGALADRGGVALAYVLAGLSMAAAGGALRPALRC